MTGRLPSVARWSPSRLYGRCVCKRMAVVVSTSDGNDECAEGGGRIRTANGERDRGRLLSRALAAVRHLPRIEACLLSHSSNKTTMSLPDRPLPYSQRPEWQDITPLPQHESLSPLAPIFYTDECMVHSVLIGAFY